MHCFVNFCSLAVPQSSVGEGLWGEIESLTQGQLKSHVFPTRILAEAISMTHSGLLYQLDISTFYFYEPLLFQILSLENLLKLRPSLFTITFTVNSHADNHFYKYIYLLATYARKPKVSRGELSAVIAQLMSKCL